MPILVGHYYSFFQQWTGHPGATETKNGSNNINKNTHGQLEHDNKFKKGL
jgi:hypothetical protein